MKDYSHLTTSDAYTKSVYAVESDADPVAAVAQTAQVYTITKSTEMVRLVYDGSNEADARLTSATKWVFYNKTSDTATTVETGLSTYKIPDHSPIVVTRDSNNNLIISEVIIIGASGTSSTASSTVYYVENTTAVGSSGGRSSYTVYDLKGDTTSVATTTAGIPGTPYAFYGYTEDSEGAGALNELTTYTAGVTTGYYDNNEKITVFSDNGTTKMITDTFSMAVSSDLVIKDLSGNDYDDIDDLSGKTVKYTVYFKDSEALIIFVHV